MELYNYIAGGIGLVALAVIIFIYTRKFAKLKTIDVSTITEEKQSIVRDRLMIDRMRRHTEKSVGLIKKIFKPLGGGIKKIFNKIYDKLIFLEKKYQRESMRRPQVNDAAFEERIKSMLLEADEALRQEDYSEAEKKYIEVISFDQTNRKAYQGLAELYFARKEFVQAIQTMTFILKYDLKRAKEIERKDDRGKVYKTYNIFPELTDDYLRLGEMYQIIGDHKKALSCFKKAQAINPNDTKTLDLLINASIINKEKADALMFLSRLAKVNPDNQKLLEYRKQIDEMKK